MTIVSLLNKRCVIYTYIHTYVYVYIVAHMHNCTSRSFYTYSPSKFYPLPLPTHAFYNPSSTFVHCWLYHYFNKQIAS